jgi:hypothetical protein
MNKYTILDISTKEGLPDITDAHVSDAGDGKFTIYSETFVPGINTKWMRGADQVLAILHENKPGQYFVVASQDYIDALDPLSEGKTTADLGTECLHYRVSGTALIDGDLVDLTDVAIKLPEGTVPSKLPSELAPWVVQGMTITSAKPSAPGSIGGVDMAKVVEDDGAGPRIEVIE